MLLRLTAQDTAFSYYGIQCYVVRLGIDAGQLLAGIRQPDQQGSLPAAAQPAKRKAAIEVAGTGANARAMPIEGHQRYEYHREPARCTPRPRVRFGYAMPIRIRGNAGVAREEHAMLPVVDDPWQKDAAAKPHGQLVQFSGLDLRSDRCV